jgi:hypothetical protein
MRDEAEIMDELHGLDGYLSLPILCSILLARAVHILTYLNLVNLEASHPQRTGFVLVETMMIRSIMTTPTKRRRT